MSVSMPTHILATDPVGRLLFGRLPWRLPELWLVLSISWQPVATSGQELRNEQITSFDRPSRDQRDIMRRLNVKTWIGMGLAAIAYVAFTSGAWAQAPAKPAPLD